MAALTGPGGSRKQAVLGIVAVVILAAAVVGYFIMSADTKPPSAAVQRADEVTETMNNAQPPAQTQEITRQPRGAVKTNSGG